MIGGGHLRGHQQAVTHHWRVAATQLYPCVLESTGWRWYYGKHHVGHFLVGYVWRSNVTAYRVNTVSADYPVVAHIGNIHLVNAADEYIVRIVPAEFYNQIADTIPIKGIVEREIIPATLTTVLWG